jgi:hypothetical protein
MDLDREAYNSAPIIPGSKRIWFLNGDLVRVHHINRAGGVVSVINIVKDRLESCLLSDFKKNREKAYTVKETSILVNRHQKYLPQLMKRGRIPYPTGAQKNGVRAWQVRSYYSESQVREIRDILSSYSVGAKRKDGLITNNSVPTIQELNRRMGSGILTYTRTEDGKFIPLWSETL